MLKAGSKALISSLAISAVAMGPGIILLWIGQQLAGMVWLFLAAFGLMARTYRKPWRLGLISCLLPPLTAAACYAFQIWLFGAVAPLDLVLLAASLGLLVGFLRARSHKVQHDDRGAPIAQRTFGYLLLWVIAYAATQIFAYFAVNSFQTRAGLVTGAFSTAMLVSVSVVIWTRYKTLLTNSAAGIAVVIACFVSLFPAEPAYAQNTAIILCQDRNGEVRERLVHTDIDPSCNFGETRVNPGQFAQGGSNDGYSSDTTIGAPGNDDPSIFAPPESTAPNGGVTETTQVCMTSNGTYIPLRGDPMALARRCISGPTTCFDMRIQSSNPNLVCPWVTSPQSAGANSGSSVAGQSAGEEIFGGETAIAGLDNIPPSVPSSSEQQDEIIAVTAAVTTGLIAAGVAVSTAQAIATAIANALQAGAQMTAEEIQAAMLEALQGSRGGPDTSEPSIEQEADKDAVPDPPPKPPPDTSPQDEGESAEEQARREERERQEREEAERQERAERERQEWEEEQARRKAEAERLSRVQDLAVEIGDDDLIERSVSERIYNSDGSVNTDYLDQLQNILRTRLRREAATSDPDFSDNSWQRIIREAGGKTLDEASDSIIVRGGTGILTGGVSEAFFQSNNVVNRVREAAEQATDRGETMSRADALRIAATEFANENLPVNTAQTLIRINRGDNVSMLELGTSMLADGMALLDVAEAGTRITGVTAGDAVDAAARRALPTDVYERGADSLSEIGDGLGSRVGAAVERIQDANSNATNRVRSGLERLGEAAGIDGLGSRVGLDGGTPHGNGPARLDPDDARTRLASGEVDPATRVQIDEVQSSGATLELDEAHQSGRQRGQSRVEAFEQASTRLDEARTGGDPAEIARAQQELRNEMIRIQGDKHGMNALNGRNVDGTGHRTIETFNAEMGATHAQTDDAVRQRLAELYDVRPEDIQAVNITNEAGGGPRVAPESPGRPDSGLASRRTPDGRIENSRAARSDPGTIDGPETGRLPDPEPSPPKDTKAGMDRDLTMRVRTTVQTPDGPRVVYRDVPSTVTGRVYNEEWYRAATGREPPPFDPGRYDGNHSTDFSDTHLDESGFVGDPVELNDPQAFARRTDQATTDRLHPEAYGTGQADLDAATKDSFRHRDLSDAAGTAATIEYKVDHWMNEAHRLQEMADLPENAARRAQMLEQARAHMEEGQRQLVKQYGNMVINRTEAMRMFGNAPGAQIPAGLADRVGVLRRVQQGELSPAQAEAVLQRMGTSTQQLGRQLSSYVEGLQTLRSPGGMASAAAGGRPISALHGWQDDFREEEQ